MKLSIIIPYDRYKQYLHDCLESVYEQRLNDYETLLETIPKFDGTSKDEQNEKLKRKFRRAYETCNKRFDDNQMLKETIKELKDSK